MYNDNKFIIINISAIKQNSNTVLMTDYKFWAENEKQLEKWCDEHCLGEFELEGMILTFYNKKDLTQFVLYWG